ncbi:uncharacterized protein G2W53_021199 [Senna tora]|uniref:Uncharacterized protein n=1 Tax=Senna tora TaxID=362788 RepID=A0A834WGZ6_9FABA|nr:uncharacterized protein G2W53_021199 [Senna tora]
MPLGMKYEEELMSYSNGQTKGGKPEGVADGFGLSQGLPVPLVRTILLEMVIIRSDKLKLGTVGA